MEPAKIDWKSLESVFVVDSVYENINAPQWIDFLNPDAHRHSLDDDHSWFCRPDCKHPKTAEDFLKSTPTSKLLRSVSVSKLIEIGHWTWRSNREANLKRRVQGQGQGQSSDDDDDENQNPDYSTPVRPQMKSHKAAIKSSAEKVDNRQNEEDDEYTEILLRSEEERPRPKLKSSQSARDLFGGRDIFGKITEFCSELKKMAASNKAKEKEKEVDQFKDGDESEARKGTGTTSRVVLGERKPLLEVVSKERCEAGERSTPKQKQLRKNKRADDAENIPIPLDLKNVMKNKEEERALMPIRTNPPTPQGFSATRDPTKSTPPKGPKSRLRERDIFQELEPNKTTSKEELGDKSHSKNASLIAGNGKEGRALDVLWFLKPCTL